LFWGTVNYSRIFAFLVRGLELTPAKSEGWVYMSGAVALLLEGLLGPETFRMEKRTFLVSLVKLKVQNLKMLPCHCCRIQSDFCARNVPVSFNLTFMGPCIVRIF